MTHIRRWRAVSLAVLALLLVVSPAEAKKSKKSVSKSKTKEVQTGDSLPKKPITDANCHDAKGVRWLAHEPITRSTLREDDRVELIAVSPEERLDERPEREGLGASLP